MTTKSLPLLAILLALSACGPPGPWRGGNYANEAAAYYPSASGGNPYRTPSPSLYMTPGPGTSITNYGGDMWSGSGRTASGGYYNCAGAYGTVTCY